MTTTAHIATHDGTRSTGPIPTYVPCTNSILGTAPLTFPGTPEQAAANRNTHRFFVTYDDEERCDSCDCRPGHRAAAWPCGEEPPRVQIGAEPTAWVETDKGRRSVIIATTHQTTTGRLTVRSTVNVNADGSLNGKRIQPEHAAYWREIATVLAAR